MTSFLYKTLFQEIIKKEMYFSSIFRSIRLLFASIERILILNKFLNKYLKNVPISLFNQMLDPDILKPLFVYKICKQSN